MILLRRALIGGALLWAAALPAATMIAAHSHPTAFASVFAVGVYLVGSAVCHQLEARSFHLWAHQMPVCARCAGIYFGAAAAAIVALWCQPTVWHGTPVSRRASVWREATVWREAIVWRRASALRSPRTLIALSLLPAVASAIYEWTTGVTPSNLTRAATGVVLGGTVAWLLLNDGTRRAEGTTL